MNYNRKQTSSKLNLSFQKTASLYLNDNHTVEQIAQIRDMAVSTISRHLIIFYVANGGINPNDFVSKREEKQILLAMVKADDYTLLSKIKVHLPEEITYEKIKWVIAKIKNIEL